VQWRNSFRSRDTVMKKAATPTALKIPKKLNNTYVCVRGCVRVGVIVWGKLLILFFPLKAMHDPH
jgi:hypothetical protein